MFNILRIGASKRLKAAMLKREFWVSLSVASALAVSACGGGGGGGTVASVTAPAPLSDQKLVSNVESGPLVAGTPSNLRVVGSEVGLSYSWVFGDGLTLNGSNSAPGHVYAEPGTYSVSVTVSNGAGASKVLDLSITVVPVSPLVGAVYTRDDPLPVSNSVLTFYAQAAGRSP